MTPHSLARMYQSLPPMLHKIKSNPMSSCSKAPRGLSVPPRVTGVFTGTTISPSPSPRQRPDRYTIRAGQNLPDKEFRYLRTVIVTAAVYWGFGSKLAPQPLTFQHWAGVSPYTSTCVLAETCVFDKQSHGLVSCGPTATLRWKWKPKKQAPNIKQFSTLQIEILNLFGIWDLKLGFSASKRRQGRAYPEVTPAVLPSSLTRVLPST